MSRSLINTLFKQKEVCDQSTRGAIRPSKVNQENYKIRQTVIIKYWESNKNIWNTVA